MNNKTPTPKLSDEIYRLAKLLPEKEKSWKGSNDAEEWFKTQVAQLLHLQAQKYIEQVEELYRTKYRHITRDYRKEDQFRDNVLEILKKDL